MDKDYENFVARMGSFEDTFEMGEDTEELKHYGVLGMRWGRRSGGSKTTAPSARQKKKASVKYNKEMVEVAKGIYKTADSRRVRAYNKTAERYNMDPRQPKDFDEAYIKKFKKDLMTNLKKIQLSDIENDPHYQKAQGLVKKYDMLKYDKLAQDNARFITEMRKQIDD